MTSTQLTRSALIHLSRQTKLNQLAVRWEPLGRLAQRFVAGETLAQAIDAIRPLNAQGCSASLDHLEEEVRNAEQTHAEVEEYQRLLMQLELTGVDANVSVKLSQLGLRFDPALCLANARSVVSHAFARKTFVRIDMEGSDLTSATLEVVERLRGEFPENAVGCVLQSALKRSEKDLQRMLALPVRVRLCKGAYLEPASIAFARKAEVDENFLRLMRRLLDSGGYHGIATHDERMIDATIAHAQANGLSKQSFELQFLYGIRRDLQGQLAKDGYRVRVYVPYGGKWYPYFMRRLAERPANLWFVARNLFKP
jgi:proline dehydrogenase